MSFDGYNTDSRLLRAIEQLAGVEMTGCDHPEHSDNAADQLWCAGMSPEDTQQKLLAILPPPADEDDELWWGETKFAVADNGKWMVLPS